MCLELNIIKSEILLKEFNRRVVRNPSYSQRAFARDLDVSHTLLSLITSHKRQLSNETAKKLLSSKNYLTDKEKEILSRDLSLLKEREDKQRSDEFIKLISDWRYYAILNLISIQGFRWESQWVSERIGISKAVAKRVMNKLVELELVEQLESGAWVRKSPKISTNKEKASESAKKFNKDLVKKALEKMEEVSYDKRDLSSITFSMNPEFVPYAIERIKNFRRSLSNELENLGEQTDVYTISVQLFPLTKHE